MREIIFRGKRTDDNKWICGYYFKSWDKGFILWGTVNGVPNRVQVIPETVGQFTGLKDKNGIEIYEGDIINCNYDDIEVWDTPSLRITITSCVEYIGSSFMIEKVYYLDYLNSDALEVIGNIHDQKEKVEDDE